MAITVTQAPIITSANAAAFTVGTNGAFTVTTTGGPTPALSETGPLPGGVAFTDNHDGTATLSGTPNAGTGATYTLTITAANGVTPDATQTFTLTVNQAPAITSGNATAFTVGTPGTFTVTTTGFPAGATMVIAATGTLPGGVAFADNHNGTATLSGTPNAATGGAYPLTITANNGVGAGAQQSFTLTVNEPPTITSANNATFTVGTNGTLHRDDDRLPQARHRHRRRGPADRHHLCGQRRRHGHALRHPGGGHRRDVRAHLHRDQRGRHRRAAALHPDGEPGTRDHQRRQRHLHRRDAGHVQSGDDGFPDGPAMAISATGTLPGGVTLTDNHDGTAMLAGTPNADTGGTYPLTITANNGVAPNATQSFTLTVDQAPAITSATSANFPFNAPGTFTVTTTGFPSGAAMAIGQTGTLPTGVTFTDNGNGTATLAGTATQGGNFPLVITANNGVGTAATQNFALSVTQPPGITSANATTFTVGTAGTFTVQANGVPTPTLSESGTLRPGVTFTDNHNGTATLAGTPNAGTGGSYPITITAANGVTPDATQTFTLTVNQAPAIITANAATFTAGTGGTLTVQTSGFPKPTLAIGGATLPTGVTFADNHDGTATLSGTPGAGTGGTYALTFTASNGVTPDATQNFTLTVNEVPTITSIASATLTVGTTGPAFTVTTTGFPKPSIARGGVALPGGVAFTDNGNGTGTLTGTPVIGTGGTYAITFTATNVAGSTPPQSFTLTVNEPPQITSGTSVTFREGQAGTFTVVATGFPKPTLTLGGATLPSGVTFVDSGNGTGTLAGTPAVASPETGNANTYAITFTATNAGGTAGPQAFTLTVKPQLPVTADDGPYAVTGGIPISVAANGVLANDTPHGATISGFGNAIGTANGTVANGTNSVTTTNGGTAVLAADGSFTYEAAANFTGADQFFYTLSNGAGDHATAKVTLTVSDRVIVVDAAAGAGGDGRLSHPFNTLSAAAGPATLASGHDLIYVKSGTYGGGIALKNSQALIGQGVSLATAVTRAGITLAPNSVTTGFPAAGTKPSAGGHGDAGDRRAGACAGHQRGDEHGAQRSSVTGVTVGQSGWDRHGHGRGDDDHRHSGLADEQRRGVPVRIGIGERRDKRNHLEQHDPGDWQLYRHREF